ncbi:MAG: DNA phosphorothioation-associated putative methyltransferase [Akkermansiaceae bacterium]
MTLGEYQNLLQGLSVGKMLPGAVYFHADLLSVLPDSLRLLVEKLRGRLELSDEFNVIKFHRSQLKVSFLAYPNFFDDPHPALAEAVLVDIASGKVRQDDYARRENRPILHRKENFLPESHPKVDEFRRMTEQEERAGLYENTRTIGFELNWKKLLKEKRLRHRGHRLIRVGEESQKASAPKWKTPRHKTAIVRRELSKPVKTLLSYGLLRKDRSILDYGCGLGGDAEGLTELGYNVSAWDPYHRADGEKRKSSVVNMGFVLNVIEDPAERVEVLHDAWDHTEDLLVVTTLVVGGEQYKSVRVFGDGILTSTGTFQKYFEQNELQALIEEALGTEAMAVASGVFYVFRDPKRRQQFFFQRTKRAIDWEAISQRLGLLGSLQRVRKRERLFEENRELLEQFWERIAELGRLPRPSEFEEYDQIRKVCGSAPEALRHFVERFGKETLEEARIRRKEDLLVALASYQFQKKVTLKSLAIEIQNDIKGFFGSYSAANEFCRELLFAAGDPGELELAVDELPWGWRDEVEGHFTFHQSMLDELPVLLRLYIACACQLYGDPHEADLIKIHLRSGKLTLLNYDDFEGKNLPELQTRTKIDMRRLFVNVFDYRRERETQILFFRERFAGPGHPGRSKMEAFGKKLRKHGFSEDRLGPNDRNVPTKERLAEALDQLGLTWGLTKKAKPTKDNRMA